MEIFVISSVVRPLRIDHGACTGLGIRAVPEYRGASCCHDDDVGIAWRATARAVTWPLVPLLLAGMLLLTVHDPDPARAGLTAEKFASYLPYFVALFTCWAVGVMLTVRVFRQGAGWAFLGLGTCIAWSGFVDTYTEVALSGRVDDLPNGTLAATFGDTSFIWWFVFLTLCLCLTPAAKPTWQWWRWLPLVTVIFAVLYQAAALVRSSHLAAPYDNVVSPLAVGSLARPAAWVAFIAVLTVGVCLLASVYVLVSAFGRARGEARQQLLWLVAGTLPVVPGIVASFAVSYADHDVVAGWIMSVCVVTIGLGAAFSVAKYRLYDVERVVTDSAAYALATGSVIAAFGLVVVVITRSIPVGPTSQLPTVLATLAGAGVARPAYLWARSAVDRHFNRRRFDAMRRVETGLDGGATDLDTLFVEALDDPSARLVFRVDDAWVTSEGHAAMAAENSVDVIRRDAVRAKLEFDPTRTERSIVDAVAKSAAAEIDNLRLRAELARQVEQVTESRSRLGDRALVRTPSDGARPARRCPATDPRHRTAASVGAGQRHT
jgi:hypothetical protein